MRACLRRTCVKINPRSSIPVGRAMADKARVEHGTSSVGGESERHRLTSARKLLRIAAGAERPAKRRQAFGIESADRIGCPCPARTCIDDASIRAVKCKPAARFGKAGRQRKIVN